jgi:hypothetical protein
MPSQKPTVSSKQKFISSKKNFFLLIKISFTKLNIDSIDASEEKKDKKKETKKFLFKKDSKDKGYSTLSADNSQDSVFLVNTK